MKIVAYYRVSSKKQGKSGLGLEAQRQTVAEFAARNGHKIIAEFTEIETGTRKKTDRPQLRDAIAHTKSAKAMLVVAKLDRLARDVEFTANLMNSEIEFVCCDNPHATKFTIHILAAVAEHEAGQISKRTKDALAVVKAKGVKLGSAREGHWDGREHLRGWKKGASKSADARTQRAAAAYAYILPQMVKWKEEGFTYEQIAQKLNEAGHVTTVKKPFTLVAVWRILNKYANVA